MLDSKDKQQIEQYIDKLISDIHADIIKTYIGSKIQKKQVIDEVIRITVNIFTPESKMMIATVYDMLTKKTLQENIFTDSENKAAFYEMNIRKELNEKFNFEIPSKIDYEESERKINEWIAAGIITVIGGVISISLKKAYPIIVAIVIAEIMTVINKNKENNRKEDLTATINVYLESVKQSLLSWVDSIAEYYDKRVNELKEKLGDNNER